LRVIAGKKRGIRLASLQATSIRPTTDSVKELIFNVLGQVFPADLVLDVFAGTGSLGIEALSRGAARAIFIENDRIAQELIQHNIERTGFTDCTEVLRLPAQKAIRRLGRRKAGFDLILADPPYNADLLNDTIAALVEWKLLKHGGWFVLEHSCHMVPDEQFDRLLRTMKKRQGETEVSFYRYG
jgi:16S rRNA (guanine(966)-N(2))-methyltransferase RsmD